MPHVHHTLTSGAVVGVSSAGKPFSRRLVVLCQPFEFGGAFDPQPLTTNSFDLHIFVIDPVRPDAEVTTDELAFTPEMHANLILEYMQYVLHTARAVTGVDYGHIGVIGWGTGCKTAASLIEQGSTLIDRAALVQPNMPLSEEILQAATANHATGMRGRVQRAIEERDSRTAPALIDDATAAIHANPSSETFALPETLTIDVSDATSPLHVLTSNWASILQHVEQRA